MAGPLAEVGQAYEHRCRRCADSPLTGGPSDLHDALQAVSSVVRLVFLLLLVGCGSGLELYEPRRPAPGPDDVEPFPERTLFEARTETPAETLERIAGVFRQIALTEGNDQLWMRDALEAEIRSVEGAIDSLRLGAGSIMRLRLGGLSKEERSEFEKAARLHARLALTRMRTGFADDRVQGARVLEDACRYDDDNAVLAIVRASYLEMAGFRSNSLRSLDDYEKDHGKSDLIDLARYRKNVREWSIQGHDEHRIQARVLIEELTDRVASSRGVLGAPSWLLWERARFDFLSDSLSLAEEGADAILEIEGSTVGDTLSAFHAHLLKGLVAVRRIDHEAAAKHFEAAKDLAAAHLPLADVSTTLRVPWDLWSLSEQERFDLSLSRRDFVRAFWQRSDPIWATPILSELEIDYYARVAEAVFRFADLDARMMGPSTEPGKVLLRFGAPHRYRAMGAQAAFEPDEVFDNAVHPTWVWDYLWFGGGDHRSVMLQDRSGSRGHYVATDSLRPPEWPMHEFDGDFLGRGYRSNKRVSRFRQLDGNTRLVVSLDTVLPNYNIRYPFQGFRYDGEAKVDCAIMEVVGQRFREQWSGNVELTQLRTTNQQHEFRRTSGQLIVTDVEAGTYQIATFLRLRDEEEQTLHVAVDNGSSFEVGGFLEDDFDASDLLVASDLEGTIQNDVERELAPGWLAFGPDPGLFNMVPRGSLDFLRGESFGYYLEIYNLDDREGVVNVELDTRLAKIDGEGEIEYEISLRGANTNLIRFGVRQWNIARSIGLGELEPGNYRFTIGAFDRIGSRKLERSVEFRVVEPAELIEKYRWRTLPKPVVS